MEKTTNTVPAHTSNSSLPVGEPVIIGMLHTPHGSLFDCPEFSWYADRSTSTPRIVHVLNKKEARWLAPTIKNCARAEQILLNRLAKNIANCVVTIYITLHYITLHYFTLWAFVRFFSHTHIFSRLYNLPPRQAFWSLTRWQLCFWYSYSCRPLFTNKIMHTVFNTFSCCGSMDVGRWQSCCNNYRRYVVF